MVIQLELISWEQRRLVFKWSAAGKGIHLRGHDHQLGQLEIPLTHGEGLIEPLRRNLGNLGNNNMAKASSDTVRAPL